MNLSNLGNKSLIFNVILFVFLVGINVVCVVVLLPLVAWYNVASILLCSLCGWPHFKEAAKRVRVERRLSKMLNSIDEGEEA